MNWLIVFTLLVPSQVKGAAPNQIDAGVVAVVASSQAVCDREAERIKAEQRPKLQPGMTLAHRCVPLSPSADRVRLDA